MRPHLLLAFLFMLVTAGCSTAGYDEVVPPPVTSLDGSSMVEGTTMEIAAYTETPAIEGDPDIQPVDDIRSDDPSIVRLEFATHLIEITDGVTTRGVIVYAVAPGTTNLRLFNGHSDEGALPITVVAVGN